MVSDGSPNARCVRKRNIPLNEKRPRKIIHHMHASLLQTPETLPFYNTGRPANMKYRGSRPVPPCTVELQETTPYH